MKAPTREPPAPWVLEFAGLCSPGPGGWMAWGWTVLRPDTGELAEGDGVARPAPGNCPMVAAYSALYQGLRRAVAWGQPPAGEFAGIVVRGDDTMLCRQLENNWWLGGERIARAHRTCLELLLTLAPYHVDRVAAGTSPWLPGVMCRAAFERVTRAGRARAK